MKTAVFSDVAQCRSCENRCFGGMCHPSLQGRKNPRSSKSDRSWLADANAVLHARIPSTLKMEASNSSETSVLARRPLLQITEDGICRVGCH
jgi:hypothetical protein